MMATPKLITVGIPFVVLSVFMLTTLAHSSEEMKWSQACITDIECTSFDVCGSWNPANWIFKPIGVVGMFFSACPMGLPPGPQPPSRCVNHQCVIGPYKVKNWVHFEASFADKKRELLYQPVTQRVESCLTAARIEKDFSRDIRLRELYCQKIDESIRGQRFPQDESLDQVADSVISCEDVISKAKLLQNKGTLNGH